MQELRLVAVSEDGTYLVMATVGRGTRFTLPIDDRLRAAVRGNFSRLGQYEIEVESPLRPKEIQARIRAGETAEEIAEAAGIPLERVRWFEGPVLQEREFIAQQALRVGVRRAGEATPGPALGDIISERLGHRAVDPEEAEWDSWKCDDGTWRVRLSFIKSGRHHTAHWVYDQRRRHVIAYDDDASRLCSDDPAAFDALDADDSTPMATVTPFVPRLATPPPAEPPAPVIEAPVTPPPAQQPPVPRPQPVPPPEPGPFHPAPLSDPAPAAYEPGPYHPAPAEPAPAAAPYRPAEEPAAQETGPYRPAPAEPDHRPEPQAPPQPAPAAQATPPRQPQPEAPVRHEPTAPPAAYTPPQAPQPPAPAATPATAPTTAPTTEGPGTGTQAPAVEAPAARVDAPAEATAPPVAGPGEGDTRPVPGPATPADAPAAQAPADVPAPEPEPAAPAAVQTQLGDDARQTEIPAEIPADTGAETETEAAPAAAAAKPKPARPAKRASARREMPPADPPPATVEHVEEPAASGDTVAPARRTRKGGRGRRASVPSWDEIMFGARKPD